MTRNEALKQFMLGLIYPAVLGSVLYAFLGTAVGTLLSSILGWSAVAPSPLKLTLLAVTVAFYCCDYLYIMFTSEFRQLFFWLDLILLLGLYVTFWVIDIGTPTLPHLNMIIVAASYAIFMLVYLFWDISERLITSVTAEQRFYNKVIFWELVSLGVLSVWLGFQPWIPKESQRGTVLAAILVLITICFLLLALGKRGFYRLPSQAGGQGVQ